MTPAARVQAAIEILDRIRDGEPAERALTRWARASRFAGSKDRAAVRDHVFDALRRRESYAWVGGANTGRGLMIGAARSGEFDLAEVFSGSAYGPASLTDAELAAGSPLSAAPEEVQLDFPKWLAPHFCDGSREFLEASRERAPLDLRVNLLKADLASAAAALATEGILTQPVPEVSTALRVIEGARKVARASAYLDGLVEIQDASSQAAVVTAAPEQGDTVLDFCAGGGGKALALAALTAAPVYVHDVDPARMKDIAPRAVRAGAQCPVWDGSGRFDLVFVDAPCSGSGTWRRAPEAKWRLTPERLEELCRVQAQVLRSAAAHVAPNGRLVYATCSVLECENGDQVRAFVAETSDWQIREMDRFDPKTAGDGFFFAILERSRAR
ncbi:MAG: RsmB/NOP family class I SAM-dependent RNA methyltransferase [Dinoroseobacter sp.]|nr:RsmB/NOP family class I SAM-dependent RNA methyltransferase [Dinoroseobacter sp.]